MRYKMYEISPKITKLERIHGEFIKALKGSFLAEDDETIKAVIESTAKLVKIVGK